MHCEHLEFEARVDVSRLTQIPDGGVVGFTADVQIRCRRCRMPFRFLGVPGGSSSPLEPRVSVHGEELRAPIEPAPGAPSWEQNDNLRRRILGPDR